MSFQDLEILWENVLGRVLKHARYMLARTENMLAIRDFLNGLRFDDSTVSMPDIEGDHHEQART